MKKIIIAPDSFKETMTNIEVADIIYKQLKNKYPNYEYKVFPIADGGEGSLNSFAKAGGCIKKCNVRCANGQIDEVEYMLYNDTIIIEVAQIVGFKYKDNNATPANTTTFGLGEVLVEALKSGLKKVCFCLGGTITNDGGCGLASALGIKFYDDQNNEFIPTGETLCKINKIDNRLFLEKYNDIEIIGLCDVTNPLYGINGASYIFAPQKGADSKMVEELDFALKHLTNIVKRDLHNDKASEEGSGAAGGLGYAIISMLNGKLKKGIDTILNLINFDEELSDDCVVITGEGKLDSQSMHGKVISGILNRTNKYNCNVIVICGKLEGDIDYFYQYGINKIIVTNEENLPFSEVKIQCRNQLNNVIDKIRLM